MTIQINDEQKEIPEATNLLELVISLLQLNPVGMAIAVNECIVARQLWDTHLLHPNDKILVIKASNGG